MNIQKAILDAVANNVLIMQYLTGGAYDRPIRRDRNADEPGSLPSAEGSTPDAFESTPPYRIKPCLSVGQNLVETYNPNGPAGAMMAFPVIYLRSRPIQSEKQKIESAYQEIRKVFGVHGNEKPFAMPGGAAMMSKVIGRMGPLDDPVFTNAVVLQVRLQVDGIWSV